MTLKQCKECGELFESSGGEYCSDKCLNEALPFKFNNFLYICYSVN